MENTKKFVLSILSETLAICRFDEKSSIPEWAKGLSFCSITRTKSELSIVCPQKNIPGGVLAEKGWRAFKLDGELGIASIGVIASLSNPLAEAGISIFNVSTFETNYVLVEEKNLAKAKEVLSKFCEIKA
ncbi:MAG: ACT domain-containing protein [Candidatus Nealsonbacteria bacterium]|nr:ACT domain-containing protein [Candidatus Nealsonbacteria bacterium]